jgi:hypothetical protein
MNFKNKKAAMEMSVGTIVTIVLLMAVLVLGLVLIQRIFSSSTNAVDNVDSQIQNEITKLFQDEGGTLVVYPSSRELTLKIKDSTPKGFAFAVKNDGVESKTFSYIVYSEDVSKCGSSFSKQKADSLLLGASGSFTLGPNSDTVSNRDIVKFILNENVPPCAMIYRLKICEGNTCTPESQNVYKNNNPSIYVTVK